MTAGGGFRPRPLGKDRHVDTRLVLRYDWIGHWRRSTIKLLEGECAVSYELSCGNRYDFKLKVGARDRTGELMTWSQLPYVTVDSVEISALDHEKLSALLSGDFVPAGDFDLSSAAFIESRIFDCGDSAQLSAFAVNMT